MCSSSPSPSQMGCNAKRTARASAHFSFAVEVSARRVIPCNIIIVDPRSPLIPSDTNGFVGVESLQVIPHRLILLLISKSFEATAFGLNVHGCGIILTKESLGFCWHV